MGDERGGDDSERGEAPDEGELIAAAARARAAHEQHEDRQQHPGEQ